MPREESEYLLDMVLAARTAVSFTEGMSFADFERDERTVFSATKAVEIVGEAAARVSRDVRQAHPDIWLAEAPPSERVGIDVPSDGGALKRLCAKMATGSGTLTLQEARTVRLWLRWNRGELMRYGYATARFLRLEREWPSSCLGSRRFAHDLRSDLAHHRGAEYFSS